MTDDDEDKRVHAALSRAAQQLETAVQEQETAVNRILGLAERLYEVIPAKDSRLKIEAIMEVCAFQDLTGQRIRKVSRLIKYLRDSRKITADQLPQELAAQADSQGLSQEQIDALLASGGPVAKSK
jgi:chemotaxis regulatin CheY-phosphate phosphatase CheZ